MSYALLWVYQHGQLIAAQGGDSCGNAQNVRRNRPRDSEGCGLHCARGKRPTVAEINGT